MEDQDVSRFFPRERFGAMLNVSRINVGLSGAGVYAVDTERGSHVLRVFPPDQHESWDRQIAVQRTLSEQAVTPPIEWVDESGPATVSVQITGPSFREALSAPATRNRALTSLVETLTRLHAIQTDAVAVVDPVVVLRNLWGEQTPRPGFPTWALPLRGEIDAIAALLERDPRRVLSHNDLNPANILWDGERVWLIDWHTAGLTHPYYDLAAIAMYLRLPREAALALLEQQERATISAEQEETFIHLRRLSTILYGLVFCHLAPELGDVVAPALADARTLMECYRMMLSGELSLQTASGQGAFASALLREALETR